MRAWMIPALALAVTLPAITQARAEYGSTTSTTTSTTVTSAATTMPGMLSLSEGTLVSHRARSGNIPEAVTVQYNWQGTPLFVTYEIRGGERWMTQGQRVNWAQASPGMMLTVPGNARIINITSNGSGGVGTVAAMDSVGNTVTLRLPDGQVRTLRYSPNAIFIRNGRVAKFSDLHNDDVVYFEIPQGQSSIALFSDIGHPRQASVSSISGNNIIVTYPSGHKVVTRTYALGGDTHFISQGQPITPANVATALQPGQTVWIFGSLSNPSLVATNVSRGFESAMIECPPMGTTAAAVTAPAEVATVPPTAESTTTTTTTPSTTESTTTTTTEGATTTTAPAVTAPCPPAATTTAPAAAMPPEAPAAAMPPTGGIQFSQGTFQSYTPAQGNNPAMVTVSYDWNGTPLMATYAVSPNDQWMSQGQAVSDWGTLQQGAMLTIPQNAQLANLTFGGTSGVGTVTAIDPTNNTVTLRLPNGDLSTLRYSPQAVAIQNGQPVMLSSLNPGDTVYFEIPPSGNQVALFAPVQSGYQGTVAAVGPDTITVQHQVNGQMVSNTYPISDTTIHFINNGQSLSSANFSTAFQQGQTVYVYGSDVNHPQLVASNVMAPSFQTAMVQPSTTTVTTATTTTAPATTTVATMAPPFDQGVLQSYTPAQGNLPATATIQYTWNGQPLTATYIISPSDQWMSQGQMVDWTQIQPGATLSVPASARLANLSFGGPTGVGVISAIDQAHNTISVRLPNGQMRTLRYSPQAIVLANGQPMAVSSLNVGDTVLFEIPPSGNQIALFTPVQPGVQATVASVGPDTITVQQMVNGQMVTQTYPITNTSTIFYNQGQRVTTTTVTTAFQPGQTVWIYGPPANPQFVATNVNTGFETAMVTPTTTAVAGSRQQVQRRPARRHVRPGK